MPRPFLETFGQMRSGKLMEDCGTGLAEIVEAVRATGKTGEMTIKIKVKPPKAGGAAYLMVEDSLSVKVPKLDHGDTVFFHTRDGGLSRQDPSQLEMKLQPVATAPAVIQPVAPAPAGSSIVSVDTKTGEVVGSGG